MKITDLVEFRAYVGTRVAKKTYEAIFAGLTGQGASKDEALADLLIVARDSFESAKLTTGEFNEP